MTGSQFDDAAQERVTLGIAALVLALEHFRAAGAFQQEAATWRALQSAEQALIRARPSPSGGNRDDQPSRQT